jgi:GTP-binding protein EngB required for normal cell division
VPTHIFERLVKCHVTGKDVPKFAKQRTAMPIYQNMHINTRLEAPESTWVQNLQMNKKVDPLERELVREIMEDHDITTEVLLQKLDGIEELH